MFPPCGRNWTHAQSKNKCFLRILPRIWHLEFCRQMSLFHMDLLPPTFLLPEDGSSGCLRNVSTYIPVDRVSSQGTILVTDVRASNLKNLLCFSRKVFSLYAMCIKNLHKTELWLTETYVWENVGGGSATGYVIFSFHWFLNSPQFRNCRPSYKFFLRMKQCIRLQNFWFFIFNIGEDRNNMNWNLILYVVLCLLLALTRVNFPFHCGIQLWD
jgi:hypothetical protein